MADRVADLSEQAKSLPAEDRLRLAELLLESIQEASPTAVEAAWDWRAGFSKLNQGKLYWFQQMRYLRRRVAY
jgi:hypothetical protein